MNRIKTFLVLANLAGLSLGVNAQTVIDQGTCGASLIWELYSNDSLSISGSGAMTDYSYSSVPWYSYRNRIKTVVIGDNVTTIGDNAFQSCNLTSVTIGDNVTTIGGYAFSDCSSLTSVSIGSNASIGSPIMTIGDWAFRYCHNLSSVTIGNSVMTIGHAAFFGCPQLTSVNLGDSIRTIGTYAFYNCFLLASVSIPNSVTTIGGWAFAQCGQLNSINIPDLVTTIGTYAFDSCINLISATIGNSVITIGDGAFRYCNELTSIIMGNSVTSIGNSAFSYCSSLDSIAISNGVTTIENSTFYYCSSLSSVIIPNGVISIGDNAFYACSGLTSITIPRSVTSIGYHAFMNCSSLTSITSLAITPPVLEYDVFYNVPKTIPIYIPCGSNSAYKIAAGWSDFTNFIEKNINTCISGTISPLTSGVVVLYSEQNGYSTDTVTVESDGGYLFDNVANGDYVVKFIPDSLEKYLPTYYGDVEYWDSSTRVTIACNCVDTVNITVLPAPPPLTGNTVISGILYEDDEGSQSPLQKGILKPTPDEGVSLQRQQGSSWETVARTVTDANGEFEFHVPVGRYRFMVDVPGMELTNTGDTTVQGQDTIKVELTLVMSEETGIKELEIYEVAKLRVYPNPAKDQLTIEYGSSACFGYAQQPTLTAQERPLSEVEVEIYDVMGRKVGTYQFPSFGGAGVVSSGEGVVLDSQTTLSYGHPSKGGELAPSLSERAGGEVIIDISHLPNGMYFLKVGNKVVKFVKE